MRLTLRILLPLLLIAAAAAGWWYGRETAPAGEESDDGGRVAVEARPVTTGALTDRRRFTGTLEAEEAFTVAPKIAGEVKRVHVNIGDRVSRGGVVAELDAQEARQAVAEAEAALGVARAELEQSEAEARLARQELARTRELAGRDMVSASELDTAEAEARAREAAVAVAEARVQERRAALRGARIRRGYTEIRADWPGSGDTRRVASRHVDPGDTVSAHSGLLDVVSLQPLTAVIHVAESDYPHLRPGQPVRVTSDALPGRTFEGEVARLAPRFAADSRRARVEIRVPNAETALRPGMFIEASVTVAEAEGVTLVPEEAVVRRDGERGVFRLAGAEDAEATAVWTPVTTGLEGDGRVQIREPADLAGRVVTLGHSLLEDGAPVTVAELPAP